MGCVYSFITGWKFEEGTFAAMFEWITFRDFSLVVQLWPTDTTHYDVYNKQELRTGLAPYRKDPTSGLRVLSRV